MAAGSCVECGSVSQRVSGGTERTLAAWRGLCRLSPGGEALHQTEDCPNPGGRGEIVPGDNEGPKEATEVWAPARGSVVNSSDVY